MNYSVVIADDHMLVRKSIRDLLEGHESFEVVGEAEDGVAAVVAIKSLKPDLLILDAAMPKATGVEVIEEVRRWSPSTRIAVVTGVGSLQMLQHIVDAGVEGLFLKSEDFASWVGDLLDICEGERRLSEKAIAQVSQRLNEDSLTPRERQVLFGIARGESNQGIADRLGISPNTIDKHRTSIMRKLEVHSATELVTRAFRDGLLDGSDLS